MKSALWIAGCLAAWHCGFEPLEPVTGRPGTFDTLDESVVVNGIQVSPKVIHPGDRVTLRDPFVPGPGQRAPLYFWDACAGTVSQDAPHGREANWVAPAQPGFYDVTVNVGNAVHAAPSRAVRLCVVPRGEETCAQSPRPPPEMRALAATPSELTCGAVCETNLESLVDAPDGSSTLTYRWLIARGQILGSGAMVHWQLPAAGCCPETYTAALTACDPLHGAATGMASVVATPQ